MTSMKLNMYISKVYKMKDQSAAGAGGLGIIIEESE